MQENQHFGKFLFIGAVLLSFISLQETAKSEIIDNFDTSNNLHAELNSKFSIENGKAVLIRTADGDSVVDWHRNKPIDFNESNDRIEIVPAGPVNQGSYSIWILFFDRSGKFIAEKQWLDRVSDTSTQVLPSMARFTTDNGVKYPATFWIRFRVFNIAGDGFKFDSVQITQQRSSAEESQKYQTSVAPKLEPIKRISKNEKQVYAHFVTWFKTPEGSGRWEMWKSDYKDAIHDPDTLLENGHRDIATTSYPLTDVYDSSDPKIIEYQFLLMKLAGIDGIIVDWDGRRINPYRHECLMKIVPYLEKYNLKLILCFEEWCGYWPKGTFSNRDAEIKAAGDEIRWMMDNLANKSFYGIIDERKPVLVFRKIADQWFNAKEWVQLAPLITDKGGAVIFDEGTFSNFTSTGDGKYFWIGGFSQNNTNTLEFCEKVYKEFFARTDTQARTDPAFVFGSAFPAFNDTPVWGWGAGPHIAPDYKGRRFELTYDLSIQNNVDLVQLVTWNDWNEGSQIEPSDTYGYKYLELNKKYASKYKGIADKVPNDALRIPLKVYRARKAAEKYSDTVKKKSVNDKLDAARLSLLDGKYQQASAMLPGLQE